MPVPSRAPVRQRTLWAVLAVAGLLGGSACGARTFILDGACQDDLERCGDTCVDTDSDPENCGACGAPCDDGGACVDGVCQGDPPCPPDGCPLECHAPRIECAGVCVDPGAHADHCGGCDRPCAEGDRCEGGACVQACDCGICGIVALPGETTGTVQGTSSPAGGHQSTSSCSTSFAPDVTYAFVAPVEGRYAFDTVGTVFDTTLTVRRGCTEVTCNDDVDGNVSSRVEIDIVAGDEVLITVDGFSDDAYGNFVLSWNLATSPCGDPSLTLCDGQCVDTTSDHEYCGGCTHSCGDEEACVGGVCTCTGARCSCDEPICGSCGVDVDLGSDLPAHYFGTTVGEPHEISPTCVGTSAPEALHRYRAPFSATYSMSAAPGAIWYDPVLFVLDRASCAELACNDDGGKRVDSYLTVTLQEGQEVVVVVDGFDGQSGEYSLNIDVLR